MKKKKYHSEIPKIIPNQEFFASGGWGSGSTLAQHKEEDINFENQKKHALRNKRS